jgi:ketosteroid isomerase-like protein
VRHTREAALCRIRPRLHGLGRLWSPEVPKQACGSDCGESSVRDWDEPGDSRHWRHRGRAVGADSPRTSSGRRYHSVECTSGQLARWSHAGKVASQMSRTEHTNMQVILEIFSASERRDLQHLLDLCHAHVEFHWPPALPYGGTSRGFKIEPPSWGHTWIPLQPTQAEQKMDPRIVAASDDEVVVLWRQRGVSPGGDRLDSPVLALYEVRRQARAGADVSFRSDRGR